MGYKFNIGQCVEVVIDESMIYCRGDVGRVVERGHYMDGPVRSFYLLKMERDDEQAYFDEDELRRYVEPWSTSNSTSGS